MKMEKAFCDRCGEEIQYPFTVKHRVIKSKYALCSTDDNYEDLCQNCSRSLNEWFKSPKKQTLSTWFHNTYNDSWFCNNCGKEPSYDKNPMNYMYCPFCGVPMSATHEEMI